MVPADIRPSLQPSILLQHAFGLFFPEDVPPASRPRAARARVQYQDEVILLGGGEGGFVIDNTGVFIHQASGGPHGNERGP